MYTYVYTHKYTQDKTSAVSESKIVHIIRYLELNNG